MGSKSFVAPIFSGVCLITQIAAGTDSFPVADPSLTKALQKFEDTKKEFLQDEVRSREIMANLYENGRKLKKLNQQRSQLAQEAQLTEEQTRELADELLVIRDKLLAQKKALQDRLRTAQRLNDGGAFQFLFSSKSSAELSRKLRFLEFLSQRDLQYVRRYQETQKNLENTAQKFEKKVVKLKQLQKEHKGKEQALVVEAEEKKHILGKLQKMKLGKLTLLNELRATGLIDSLARPSLFEKKGQLHWPVQGKVGRTFGLVQDTQHRVVLPHPGVFLQTSESAEVRAVSAGKVVHAGPVKGFENVVILDHGDHYYTVYGSLARPMVQLNQNIQANQTLAMTAMSPFHHSTGLYFEIRYFSEPENPIAWMKGQSL